MSVLLHVKMDVQVGDATLDEARKRAFPDPIAGAKRIQQLPGLQWKIWIQDSERRQTGGIYLFADRSAAEQYAYRCVRTLQDLPGISNVTAQLWTISEEQTRITSGPIDAPLLKDLL